MKTYHIDNIGCDDSNNFNIELTDEEFKTVIKVFDANNKLADCCCTPHLYIYEYREDDEYYNDESLNKDYKELKEGNND